MSEKNPQNITALQDNIELVKTLREQCPWDKEQTHLSLRKHLIEESNEVVEAISELHPEKERSYTELKEELGDLWLQILLHSQIASEKGKFDIYDVAEAMQEKMVRRHPHVFSDSTASTPEELKEQWEKIKREETQLKRKL